MIPISANFDVLTSLPIDGRTTAVDIAARNAITWTYNGLICFVESESINYQYISGNWQLLSSTDAVSASWASSSISASWAPMPITSDSSSWASSSISASYAPVETVYSASISTQLDTKQDTLTNILYVLTASLATSASYYPAQVIYASSSWASSSISASYAPFTQTIQTTVASASWVSSSVLITTAQTASYVASASYYPSQVYQSSGSWASASISTSYAKNATTAALATTVTTTAVSDDTNYIIALVDGNTIKYDNSVTFAYTPDVEKLWVTNIQAADIAATSVTASLFGTASNAISASWSPQATPVTTVASASWSSQSISASYAPVQPSYSASVSTKFGTKQDTLTNTLYTITASLATSASYYPAQVIQTTVASASWVSSSSHIDSADTASYFVNASASIDELGRASFANSTVTINDHYGLTVNAPAGFNDVAVFNNDVTVWGTITGSLLGTASVAISASWAPQATPVTTVASASWSSASISASYSPVESVYSASVSTQFGTKQNTLSNTLYVLTASLATSASYYPAQVIQKTVDSASWASASLSASVATTASYAKNAQQLIVDYDWHLMRNSNTVLQTTHNFIPGTVRLARNGMMCNPDYVTTEYDYVESGSNQLQLHFTMSSETKMMVDYLLAN